MNSQNDPDAIKALEFLKTNKKLVIQQFTKNVSTNLEEPPISLYMAGSPGAGKTEFSRRLVESLTPQPVIIDADEIRKIFPGYVGNNSGIFQTAATKGVNLLHDYALHHNLNMILDGTFAYNGAMENINRSLSRKRKVLIYYIYQKPEIAWLFTQKREELEHRKVTLGLFIYCFIGARENVIKAKQIFGNKIELNLVLKNFDTETERIFLNVEKLDDTIFKGYTVENLKGILG